MCVLAIDSACLQLCIAIQWCRSFVRNSNSGSFFKLWRDESLVLQVGGNLLLSFTVVVAIVVVGTFYREKFHQKQC